MLATHMTLHRLLRRNPCEGLLTGELTTLTQVITQAPNLSEERVHQGADSNLPKEKK